MKRIWNKAKRAGALALAAVLLAGTLAMSASAAADPNYLADWGAVWAGSDSYDDAETGYEHIIQKYPNGTDAYFWYVRGQYITWWNEDEAYDWKKVPKLLTYLDKLIALDDVKDNPYAATWNADEEGMYVDPDGETRYYTLDAIAMKEDLHMWWRGHQEQSMDAVQEYLDHWEKNLRESVTDSAQTLQKWKQTYLSWGYSAAEAAQYAQEELDEEIQTLNQTIPAYRAELDEIRRWYTSGQKSFTVGAHSDTEGVGTLRVNGGVGDKTVKLSTNNETIQITTSDQIYAVQRTLNKMTIFVKKGTRVNVESVQGRSGSGFMIWDESYKVGDGFEIVAGSQEYYNGDSFMIFVSCV